jgi:hypothetical protein
VKARVIKGWDVQYIPNMPKNPQMPRATKSSRMPFAPMRKSGTFFHHIQATQNAMVSDILAKSTWKGSMPSPSSSNSLVVTFMSAPKSWDIETKNSPSFLCQNPLKEPFHVLGCSIAFGVGEMPLECIPIDETVLIDSLLTASKSNSDTSTSFLGLGFEYIRFVPPFRARSKLLGIFCSDSKISSSK